MHRAIRKGWAIVFVIVAVGRAAAQDSPPERGHGLSEDEARAGWISLFDGRTAFGWSGSRAEAGRLSEGETTTAFGDGEVRGEAEHGGRITAGGRSIAVEAGRFAIASTGRRGQIGLRDGLAVRTLVLRPRVSRTLFDGRDLSGCTPMTRPGSRAGSGPKWSLEGGWLHALGGPGAMELPGRFADFLLQVEVRTRGRHSNGGVFFRNPPGSYMMGYEAQVYNRCEGDDPARPSVYATGAIDDRQNARRLVSRDALPFTLTIAADGPHLATWVDGHQVTDWTDTRPRDETPRRGLRTEAGTIQLQAHDAATDLEFGKVLLSELDGAG